MGDVKKAVAHDIDRAHGLHTQDCFDYARKTMAESGRAYCIVSCADARSARLASSASKVPAISDGIDKARERALDALTAFDVSSKVALEVLNVFEGAVVDELAALENVDFNAVKPALQFLLTRIGSWTHARWDQHLRHEFGDEKAEQAIRWIEATFDVKAFADSRQAELPSQSNSEVKGPRP